MIIYGTGGKLLKNAEFDHECANCGHNKAWAQIYQRWAHIFWIPTFPAGKTVTVVCQNCENALEGKSLPEEIRNNKSKLKSTAGTPLYSWTGLVILALIITGFIVSDWSDDQTYKEYLSEPKKGDVYLFYDDETPDYKYSFLKVTDVFGDSISYVANYFSYDGIPDKLDAQDGFVTEMEYSNSIAEMTGYFDQNVIKKVYRDETRMGFSKVVELSEEEILQQFTEVLEEIGVDSLASEDEGK